MRNLKQRLEPMRLTEQQKKRIKAQAKIQPTKSQSFISVVLPAFILLAVFFVFVSLSPNGLTILGERTTAASQSVQNTRWTSGIILWNSVNTIMLVLIVHYFKKCLKYTVRWQHDEKIQEWHAFFSKSARVILVLVLSISILWLSVYVFPNIWVVQIVFVFLTVTLLTVIFIYDIRERYWTTCPHCQVAFTRKQIQRKSFIPFREKCDQCEKPIYVNPKENQRKIYLFWVPLLPWWMQTIIGLHFSLVVLLSILVVISLWYFYFPYMIQFSDKDTSLEDFNK